MDREHAGEQQKIETEYAASAAAGGETSELLQKALEQAREPARLLQALARASLAISQATTFDELMQVITDEVCATLGAQQASTSFAADGNWPECARHTSRSRDGDDTRLLLPIDELRLYEMVCAAGSTVRLSGEAATGIQGTDVPPGHPDDSTGNVWLAAPLKGRDNRHVGMLLACGHDDQNFDSDDEETLAQVARMAAAALELHHAHEKLRETNRQIREANRELEAFSYSVSHDLRAPLRAIHGFSRILVEDYGNDLTEDARELLDLICANTTEMGQMVDGLLAFSRLNRCEMSRERVKCGELVERCLTQLRADHPGRHIEFEVEDLPDCHGDPALIRQIWWNLLENAVKFTSKVASARIRITAGSTESETTESDTKNPVYCVADNGAGFDMRYASKLFGVFQRLHRAEEFEGTGVGLATVQRIVNRHGGRVWAFGWPGQGAGFCFSIPGRPTDE